MHGASRTEGVTAYGLEPRETRWQLEQQRAELPFGKPEQQQPVEQQQQQRFPCSLPAPSPMGAKLVGPTSRPFPHKRDEQCARAFGASSGKRTLQKPPFQCLMHNV